MSIQEQVQKIAVDAHAASLQMSRLDSETKNRMLLDMATALEKQQGWLIAENASDLAAGSEKGLSEAMLDRLMLDEKRIKGIADALREVAALPDPVGEVTKMWQRPNQLMVGKMRIPLGVIGIIYEARPNVTADAAADQDQPEQRYGQGRCEVNKETKAEVEEGKQSLAPVRPA